jgi:hypothetical protein
MIVYILLEDAHFETNIEGVYSTVQKAKDAAEKRRNTPGEKHLITIRGYEIDKEEQLAKQRTN